jgi:hypothetical protein
MLKKSIFGNWTSKVVKLLILDLWMIFIHHYVAHYDLHVQYKKLKFVTISCN